MRFEVKLDFDYLDNDDQETSFTLPNGVVISFWNCKIKYINNDSLNHYLLINSEQQQNINEAIILLSFFSTVPLIAIYKKFDKTNEDYSETLQENKSTKEWCEKLGLITEKLKTKSKKHRDEIFSLMQMCSLGTLHEYRQHEEEQFFMYFKTVEKIAKLQIDKKCILQDTSGNRKKSFKKFLENLFNDDFSKTSFDDSTIAEISGSLNGLLEKNLKSNNHRRIVIAWSSMVEDLDNEETSIKLRKIDSSRIQNLVKIRNDIAHGNIVSINTYDLADIEYLSRQMISIFYFGNNFESYCLGSTKFGNRLW